MCLTPAPGSPNLPRPSLPVARPRRLPATRAIRVADDRRAATATTIGPSVANGSSSGITKQQAGRQAGRPAQTETGIGCVDPWSDSHPGALQKQRRSKSSVVGRRLYLSTYLSIYLSICLPAYVRHSAKRRLADSLVVVVTCELAGETTKRTDEPWSELLVCAVRLFCRSIRTPLDNSDDTPKSTSGARIGKNLEMKENRPLHHPHPHPPPRCEERRGGRAPKEGERRKGKKTRLPSAGSPVRSLDRQLSV